LVVAMVAFLISVPATPASATFTYSGYAGPNCMVQGCYDQVYCDAIECFHQAWAQGRSGEECCGYNNTARFCGSDCPLFCAEP
jgi:hypothetical protein